MAIGMGFTFVPPHFQTDDSDVAYCQLQGSALTLQLAIACRRDHCSPVIQQFLSVVEETLGLVLSESGGPI